jgi:hypothetical protein
MNVLPPCGFAKSNPIHGGRRGCLRPRHAENALRRHYERAKSCKTNPISLRRGVRVQNEANLAWPEGKCAKQDAHDKSPQVGLRPAFWGGYRRSIRLTPTFVVGVKQTQFRGVGWRVESSLFHHSIIPPLQSDPGRAKRSQTWMDWGIWEKEVVACGVARPGSETCETNPILGGVSRWKCQETHEGLKGAGDGRQRSVGHTQIPV